MLFIRKCYPLIVSLILLLLLNACGPAQGAAKSPEKMPYPDLEISVSEIEQITSEVKSKGETIITESMEVLYDLNDQPCFLIVEIEPEGFVIWFRYPYMTLSEQSKTSNPYASSNGTKYYAGPMSYILFDGESYVDILSGHEFDEHDINRGKTSIEDTYKRMESNLAERQKALDEEGK